MTGFAGRLAPLVAAGRALAPTGLPPRSLLGPALARLEDVPATLFLAEFAPRQGSGLRPLPDAVWNEIAEVLGAARPGLLLTAHGASLAAGLLEGPPPDHEAALDQALGRIETSSGYGRTPLVARAGLVALPAGGPPEVAVDRADRALGLAVAEGRRVALWTAGAGQVAPRDRLAGVLTGDCRADHRHVALLDEALALAATADGLADFLPRLLDLIVTGTGAQRGAFLLMGARSTSRVFLARDASGHDLEELGRASRSIPEDVHRTGRSVHLEADATEAVPESVVRHDLRSILCVPIVGTGGDRPGVLYLDSDVAIAAFGPADLRFVEALGTRIGPWIAAVLDREAERRAGRSLRQENERLRSAVESDLVVRSAKMARAIELARRVAPTDSTVLVTGESGCGKERIARLIHAESRRAERPLVVVNCAAIPRDLLESELFGHEKGAFTGAVASRKGKFEQADTGTVFLDEIGEIGVELQPKLLRFLQQGELEKVGGVGTRTVDVRIVAATNRDLAERIALGAFREDLYFRLNVFPIELPPLRDRPEDVRPLFDTFVERQAARFGRRPPDVEDEVYRVLESYSWPGNVRELENCAERAMILTDDGVLLATDLGLPVDRLPAGRPVADGRATLAEGERELIRRALDESGGNKTRAARLLGIPRTTLYHKLHEHGLA